MDQGPWGKGPFTRRTPSLGDSCPVKRSKLNFQAPGIMCFGSVSQDNLADHRGASGRPRASLLPHRLAGHPACPAWGAITLIFF